MRVFVSPEFAAGYETSLLDFIAEHRIPASDLETIISDLHFTGQHIRGGISEPFTTLELVDD